MSGAKTAIQNTFLRLYKSKPYAEISVSELCSLTPVARTTFYYYYDNIGNVKEDIENRFFDGLLKQAAFWDKTSYSKDLKSYISIILDYVLSKRKVNYAFLVTQPNTRYIEKWKVLIKRNIEEKLTSSLDNSHNKLIAEIIAASALSAYAYCTAHIKSISEKQIGSIADEINKLLKKIT